MEVQLAQNKDQLNAIIGLRYEILRRPWNQPFATATDALEDTSLNAFIATEDGETIACGRLQFNDANHAQVRYMAVSEQWRGKGLGKQILAYLEKKAVEHKRHTIELQARENAVDFYQNQGYEIAEKTFLLWGIIQHYKMVKTL